MRKRTPLDALGIATQAKANALDPGGPSAVPPRETLTTAIHLPRATWSLLRAVAFKRAQTRGGRASVSSLLVELVERHRVELEQEVGTSLTE
jgi:hypothetical protein